MNPTVVAEKKKVKIRFAEEKSSATAENTQESAVSNTLLDVSSPLQKIIKEAASTSLLRSQDSDIPSVSHMRLLSVICSSFPNETLVKHLYCARFGKTEFEMTEETNWNKAFLQDVMLPWIERVNDYKSDRRKHFTEGIVKLLFMIYKLGSTAEKTFLLALLCKVRIYPNIWLFYKIVSVTN